MIEVNSLIIVVVAFLSAGAAKGVVGFGIQVVALAIMTIALDLITAMAVMLVPSLITNVWQASVGGYARQLMSRLWPFLLAVAATVFIGVLALTRIELLWLTALLGLVMCVYALIGLAGVRMSVSPRAEVWLGPLFGIVNGLIMGMTGSSVVPGTMYLQSLGLGRDALVQAMGLLYMIATLALMAALQYNQLLNLELGIYSAVAVIPALLGMLLGQKIRRCLAEAVFRKLFFYALLGLGVYLLQSSL